MIGLFFGTRLVKRTVAPLILMGITLGAIVLVSFSALQSKMHQAELENEAGILVAAVESSAEIFSSTQELMDYVSALGGETLQLQSLALVDPTGGRVVAATVDAWIGRQADQIPQLRTMMAGKRWLVDGARDVGFVREVVVKNASLNRVYGEKLKAIVILDGLYLKSHQLGALEGILLVSGAGATLILVATFWLVRRNILVPLGLLQHAVDKRARKTKAGMTHRLRLPRLADDEIGQLGKVLERAFSALDDTHERMRVLSTAVDRSSNEVYMMEANEKLRFVYANDAALQNLGYSLDEFHGIVGHKIAPDLAKPEVLEKLGHQLIENHEIHHQYHHIRKDGSTYQFEYKSIFVEGDNPLIITVGSDVTERIVQEQRLQESEERMQLALSGSRDGLFDYDLDKNQIYVSDSVQQWMRLNQDNLHVNQFFQLLADEDSESVITALRETIKNDAPLNVEFRLRRDSELRWLSLRGQVVKKADRVARVSGFVSDITSRKVADDLINTTVNRLGAVLNNIADGILTLSDDGRICTVNPAGEQMLGSSSEALVGRSIHELSPFVQQDVFKDWLGKSDGVVHEASLYRGDGSIFPAEVAIAAMEAVVDERYTVVIRDITQRKEHEASLEQAILEAQNATRAKAEFLATMSHEIRTPMNGVLGMTQLLLGMELGREQRDAAQLIFSSGDSLLSLINDILDFSKIEAGRIELEEIAFDLHAAVREVVELLATTARSKNLDLLVDFSGQDAPYLVGDVGRIRQVLLNLVGNAVKFTETGHVVIKVDVQPQGDASQRAGIKLSVSDTGIGIAPEAQKNLFESFTQADASTTRKFGGTGLGLAISKQLVGLMGGELSVQSVLGEGSEFIIQMELARASEVVASTVVDYGKLEDKRVLIVDDNPIGRHIGVEMAREFGMQAASTEDPEAVLGMMETALDSDAAFDLVALDYNMPGMDGLSLASNIRADKRFATTKLILITSSDLERPSGIDGYALKPYFRDTLAQLFNSALYGSEASDSSEPDHLEQVGQGLKILVAEDNPVNQRVATKMLEKLGATADVAANGLEAFDMSCQFNYDIIFMDCQMPELDGYEATARIREYESTLTPAKHIPIIAMTANALSGDRENCLAAGMDDYASKPIKLDLLSKLIQRWCRGAERPKLDSELRTH